MALQTTLTKRLGITHPIILAPMAGGPSTPELAAAVSNAGGLGTLGAGYLSATTLREEIAAVRRLTDRPFGVNLLVPPPATASVEAVARAQALLDAYRDELGLARSPAVSSAAESLEAQVDVVAEARIPVFSFAFGIPTAPLLNRLRASGSLIWGTATTVAEARLLEAAGVDAVIGQGGEAGAHRGTFATDFERGMVGTLALIPQLVDAVRVPVIAAGGIMDGRGLLAALALGATAAQMGTAFLRCPECGASAAHKAALAASTDDGTVVTRAFSGRPARGIRNRMIEELGPHADELPGYPMLNALTRDIRQAAGRQGRAEFLSLWAGQGTPLGTEKPAEEVVREVAAQVEAALRRLAGD
jgi:nitronate monooxygenase